MARGQVCSLSHFITAEVLLRADTPGGVAADMAQRERHPGKGVPTKRKVPQTNCFGGHSYSWSARSVG
jgi:hypothetical protein